MKRITFSLLLLLITGVSQAQSFDKELLKVYEINDLQALEQDQPEKISVLNYALANACYFAAGSAKDYSNLPTITLENSSSVPSFVDLGLKIENQNQYFKVANSDKLLVVKSMIVLEFERKNATKK
ncbi:MAG: hypothetical protein V4638_02425 [Bacteroidota bacterium]